MFYRLNEPKWFQITSGTNDRIAGARGRCKNDENVPMRRWSWLEKKNKGKKKTIKKKKILKLNPSGRHLCNLRGEMRSRTVKGLTLCLEMKTLMNKK